ncbi:MAG: DUF4097 family beta strand repeat-containing protein [Candidatus Cyclobacteriaceae bacterium M2_1C_046]
MKYIIGIVLITLIFPSIVAGQMRSEQIQKNISVNNLQKKTVLVIANINGSIKVEKGDQDQVLFDVNKEITAETESLVKEGWDKANLRIEQKGDTILAYIETPCHTFTGYSVKDRRWGYNTNCQEECMEDWSYKFDFALTVPEQLNLHVSTIKEGKIDIANISGKITAYHVNGDITVDGAVGAVDLYTINGDVNISYARLPDMNSSYYTLNGNINASFPSGLSADMHFESFNGDFYTNINDVQHQSVVKNTPAKSKGSAYKIEVNSNIRARSGGVVLDFETFNGDVYVKENNK